MTVQVGEVTGEGEVVVVPVARPRLWSPKDPHLYTLKVREVPVQVQTNLRCGCPLVTWSPPTVV